jgi:hypothetical protein
MYMSCQQTALWYIRRNGRSGSGRGCGEKVKIVTGCDQAQQGSNEESMTKAHKQKVQKELAPSLQQ